MTFIISFLLYLILDSFWFKFTKPSYAALVNKIQKESANFKTLGLILAYPLLTLGLTVFVLPQATLNTAFTLGAINGLVNYGLFNATNYFLFNDWSINISIIDTLWGTLMTGIVAWLTVFIKSFI